MVDSEELEKFRRHWKNELTSDPHTAEGDKRLLKRAIVVKSSSHCSTDNKCDKSDNKCDKSDNKCDKSLDDDGREESCSKSDTVEIADNNKLSVNKEVGEAVTLSKPIKFRRTLTSQQRQAVDKGNTFKPFLIAEKLLGGVSAEDTFLTTDGDEANIREAFIKVRNKRLKLSSLSASPPNATDEKSASFLDIFLADLNDINEIPFFETSLPRELAIKIFKYLDACDLCRCCQVSKAWKSLAEDELLWNQICCDLGYEESAAAVEKSKWKEIVREHVLKERQLRQNWKMRHGEMSSLEYVTGGILCAASSWHHRLVAGYSNGEVRVWDDDDDHTFNPSNTALLINESAECGTVSNIVNKVCVNDQLAAASYTQGNVDIWMIYSKKASPINTLRLSKQIASLSCSNTDSLVVLNTCNTVWVYDDDATSGKNFSEIPVGDQISHLKIIPKKKQLSSRQLLAISLYDQVKIHGIGDDPSNMMVMHNTINQKVTSLDCSNSHIAVGVHSEDANVVKLFDLHKLREVNTLLGSTLPVCVINLADSPLNSLVTGSSDGKVRVYDTRLVDPVIELRGHAGVVKCVQMDDWKVVSGGHDGMVIVWDQRMANKLWEQHHRHPVEYMAFKEHMMYTANIPVDKAPESDSFDSIYHRRYRGSLCCYNFSVDIIKHPDLPSNVLSTYDDPEGYNYNINLAVPYD